MKRFKFKVNNKMRDFGVTDFEKKTVTINKKLHAKAKANPKKYGLAKKDTTLLNTIVHEKLHTKHPKMTEKAVRKLTRSKIEKMSPFHKKREYRPFQYPTKWPSNNLKQE